MKLLSAPLDQVKASDIEALIADRTAENAQFELKQDLSSKGGKKSGSTTTPQISDQARNKIAQEIVAFANTYGGLIVVGIEESSDEPKRAVAKAPVPACHEVARRLRQAICDVIDPPLPIELETVGVVTEEDGESGVVILRVGRSRRAPHRVAANREVYVRRLDESVKVDMREIQELTLRSYSDAGRVDTEIERRQTAFQRRFSEWLNQPDETGALATSGCGFHFIGVPTTAIDLGRVAGRPELQIPNVGLNLNFGGNRVSASWPFSRSLVWRPALGAIVAEYPSSPAARYANYSLSTEGVCELAFSIKDNAQRAAGLYASWLFGSFASVLFWIEAIRRSAGFLNLEYALASLIIIAGTDTAALTPYGQSQRGWDDESLPLGKHQFPVASVGSIEEFPSQLARFDEQLWNLCGRHYAKSADVFDLGDAIKSDQA